MSASRRGTLPPPSGDSDQSPALRTTAGHALLILDASDIIVAKYYYYLKGNDCPLSTHSYLSGAWRVTAVLEPSA